MLSSTTSASRIALAALLASAVLGVAASGCSGGSGGSADPASDEPSSMPSRADAPKKAPSVGGPASGGELTDALGVFVAPAPAGQAGASGSHDQPLASIQEAIDLATHLGKRVYVCAGTFHEALTVADSIAIIGGLDCTGSEWHVSDARTRVDAPTSPAIRALGISTVTRIEGLEVYAPSASTPSGSSIALLADHAPGLVIARTRLVAGNAAAGADGVDGIQLVASPHNAEPATTAASCATPGSCAIAGIHYVKPFGARGGTNACAGAPGHTPEAGGNGGSGGVWQAVNDVGTWHFHALGELATNAADNGVVRTGAPGNDGINGANATPLGTFSRDGYAPAHGTPGADGASGSGGSGGAGRTPAPDYDPNTTAAVSGVWRGFGGAGGGAGGCPGLAGTAGEGGGASIAALLLESPVTFDGAELQSGAGGSGGHGAFGSVPTAGGVQGVNVFFTSTNGQPGGRGGAAGISGNGANGPTAGIAVLGAKPVVGPTTTLKPGTAAPAIPPRSRTSLDFTRSIPATPAGRAEQILAL